MCSIFLCVSKKETHMLKKLLAEFAGTFFLVFAGTGAIVINQETNGAIGHMGIAFTFGLIVCVLVYAFGNISGAHLNPAVSIGLWSAGKFELKELPGYILAQLAGAFAATLSLKWFFPMNKLLGTTLPYNDSWKMAFGMEFILTFLLVFVILRIVVSGDKYATVGGIVIGFVILLEAMFAGPVSGASMNPARSLAPAIVSGATQHLWAYVFATIGGGLVAAITHTVLFDQQKNKNT
jgi:aquaporin NIP